MPHAVIALLLSLSAAGPGGPWADAVYLNGDFYTLDPRAPHVEAVAILEGRFLRVGSREDVAGAIGPRTEVVDLGGAFVLPGLVDPHTHPSFEAEEPFHFEAGVPWDWLRRHRVFGRWLIPTRARRVGALADATRIISSYGITSFGDGCVEPEILPLWQELLRRRAPAQRAVFFVRALGPRRSPALRSAAQVVQIAGRQPLPDVRFGAKLWVDGYFWDQSAALDAPYQGARGRGGLTVAPAVLERLVGELDRAGFPIQAHAIGERGVGAALDAFEAARRGRAGPGPQHAVVHAHLVRPEDLPRFAALGVAASLDAYLAQPAVRDAVGRALGPARRERYLPFRALREAGALVGAHSDWASASMSPFLGMYVLVTRRSPGHPERGALGPGNAITLAQAIRAYTLDNARLLGMEREVGSIEPGKSADLAILDRDLLHAPLEALRDVRVRATVFRGRRVYDGAELPLRLARSERELVDLGNAH
ncbi:amidohydrolase [Anaeromyxobacter paludicola]|nr:amidohydrolase family protein [Anaeromyxobacter paludicola]